MQNMRLPLLTFIQEAFARLSQMHPEKVSRKRRPSFIGETGPEAATKYRSKHPLHPGRGSSIRKLQRAMRIEVGLRPLKYEVLGRRERKVLSRGTL